jgi:hypothetical protein
MRSSVTESPALAAPAPTVKLGEARDRTAVVVAGIVTAVDAVDWAGGPVLEAHVRDETGAMCLAFLGRRAVGGVEPGAFLTIAGTIGHHAGERVILNPRYWLSSHPRRSAAPARSARRPQHA